MVHGGSGLFALDAVLSRFVVGYNVTLDIVKPNTKDDHARGRL